MTNRFKELDYEKIFNSLVLWFNVLWLCAA